MISSAIYAFLLILIVLAIALAWFLTSFGTTLLTLFFVGAAAVIVFVIWYILTDYIADKRGY